jgi:hypothetical protein
VQVKWDVHLALASNAEEFRAVIENLLSNRCSRLRRSRSIRAYDLGFRRTRSVSSLRFE